jgi:putative tricarboxylic transport membrane protein
MASNRLRSIRHLLAAATLSVSCFAAAPALAQVSVLEIVAHASPGGGWDQHARALQQTLMAKNLATGVQVVNVPGAGGTIGLAQFVTARKRNPSLLIGGQIM